MCWMLKKSRCVYLFVCIVFSPALLLLQCSSQSLWSIESFEASFHSTITGSDALFSSEIAKHLSLPLVKLHCSMLAEDAIKAAVKDYDAKKAKMGQNGKDGPAEEA